MGSVGAAAPTMSMADFGGSMATPVHYFEAPTIDGQGIDHLLSHFKWAGHNRVQRVGGRGKNYYKQPHKAHWRRGSPHQKIMRRARKHYYAPGGYASHHGGYQGPDGGHWVYVGGSAPSSSSHAKKVCRAARMPSTNNTSR